MSATELLLLLLFFTGFGLELIFQLWFFMRLAFYKEKHGGTRCPGVSVVICSRSEAHKLVENLPYILEQDYPDYEVVVVDDKSWDDTREILKAFEVKYPHLKVVQIPDTGHNHKGKKMALTIGIKGASKEVLLLTDADCRPASNQWISEMVKGYNDKTTFVLGYSPYLKKKGFLNQLIRFDTFLAAVHYLSFSLAGTPYMGVGRNLSYKRDFFLNSKGFKRHYHIASGDDDLFINENATGKNTSIVISEKSIVTSLPKKDFLSFFKQKKRHFTTAPYYKWKHKFLLAMRPLAFWLMFLTTPFLFFLNIPLWIIGVTWFLRELLVLFTFGGSARKLGEKDLLPLIPLLEIVIFFLHLVIYISNQFVRADKWN